MYGIGFQELFILFIFFGIPSIAGYKLAQIKKRNKLLWALFCFLLPPALIIIAFLGKTQKGTNVQIKCPYCCELIIDGAIICKHCGSNIKKDSEQ